jgi:hypothetical protein
MAGVVWGIFSYVVHGIVNGGIFKDWYKGYENLFRAFDTTMMVRLFILSILMGLVYAFLYLVFHKAIAIENNLKKGALFGAVLFLPQLVGLLFDYAMSPAPFPLPCLISGLITMPIGGMLIALVYGDVLEE